MAEIDFYKLSRAVQDSLLDSLRGQFTPKPIVFRLGVKRAVEAWLAVAAAAGVTTALTAGAAYGDATSSFALQPIWVAPVYALLIATSIVSVLNAAAYRARLRM